MRKPSVLIIGGDSLIGRQLEQTLHASNIKVWKTSRREVISRVGIYFLDLADITNASTKLPPASTIILCGAVSGYATCVNDPATAAQINVVNTIRLASSFLQQKCHVIFLSSAAAMGAEVAPTEDIVCSPKSVYGVLKRATELGLESEAKKYNAPLSIVRLTKIVSWDTPFINRWVSDALMGLPIKAFANCYLSPITVSYVCDVLTKLILSQSNGVFHLSGEGLISYFQFAEVMKSTYLLPNLSIQSVINNTRDSEGGFFDTALLSMTETTRNIGVKPEPFDNVLHNLKVTMINNIRKNL